MTVLLEPLHCSRPKLRIRIVGTNGKGSTAFMLSAGLQAAGLKVGLYTSPHVLSFNERIRVDGVPISNADLLQYLEVIMPVALHIGASYFEVATALALHCFSQAAVDVEILEAGVGARLDATTAVAADMALITPIDLDHQTWLGDSIAEVAAEKAYALNGCRWGLSVLQPNEVAGILEEHHDSLMYSSPLNLTADKRCRMLGEHQKVNAALACSAIEVLLASGVIHGNKQLMECAAMQAVVLGRLQHVTYHQADIWLDAAHNRHAVEALLPTLPTLANPLDAILVYTREDRSLVDSMALLRPYTRELISDMPSETKISYTSPEMALKGVLNENAKAKILLLGSFLSVTAGLRWLQEHD